VPIVIAEIACEASLWDANFARPVMMAIQHNLRKNGVAFVVFAAFCAISVIFCNNLLAITYRLLPALVTGDWKLVTTV
jgi:hypothetical protein